MIENILIAALTSGNILLFIKFMIERHDRMKEKAAKTDETLDRISTLEKDGIRTQLLLLILLRPDEKTEILRIAEHYFKVLKGNWYMTSIFNMWLEEYKVARPEWFNDD